MTGDQAVSTGPSDMDYPEHDRTYAGFVKLTKYGVIFLVILLVGMAKFLL